LNHRLWLWSPRHGLSGAPRGGCVLHGSLALALSAPVSARQHPSAPPCGLFGTAPSASFAHAPQPVANKQRTCRSRAVLTLHMCRTTAPRRRAERPGQRRRRADDRQSADRR